MKHVGFNAHRLAPSQDNPREVAFATEWEEENARALDNLHVLGRLIEAPVTDRDCSVAATIIQWLGSNVGFSFLRKALERCGYTIVDRQKYSRLLDAVAEVEA